MSRGKVYLVGAGPGDAELLTLKAVKALKRADVILVDDLVADDVLAYARPNARIVRVGKRGGRASTSQDFIERLMVSEARHGRIVVRLKGGDPMVFGRGGEECEALRAAGVHFEVVNGITSGLAAATAAGIALTHREHGHGAIFVTGTANDWAALAATGFPLVIYMGVARCAAIERALLEAGMRADMPVAAIANATRRDQRIAATCLERMSEDLRVAGIASPAILVVGSIAASAAVEMAHEVEQHVAG
jgi:uroporphyrin-III C-methyltransferase